MLTVQALSKRFGQTLAVSGVSFDVGAGEIVALLGPNGAGKSTTIRMITGMIEPATGHVVVNGRDMGVDRHATQRMIGYLPEGAPIDLATTPIEYLSFQARLKGIPAARRDDRLENVISGTGLEGMTRKRCGTLSKGYRRRVALAAAILADPPLLVLDEPADGLDPNQKRLVQSLLRDLSEEHAILMSTHNLEEVAAICTRVILMAEGRVRVDEPVERFLARAGDGALSDVFHALTLGEDVA